MESTLMNIYEGQPIKGLRKNVEIVLIANGIQKVRGSNPLSSTISMGYDMHERLIVCQNITFVISFYNSIY